MPIEHDIDVETPSGMRLRMRGLRMREAAMLASSKNRSGTMDRLFGACWKETLDPGRLYDMEPGARPDWSRLIVGDREALLWGIRRATFGDDYEFKLECSECSELVKITISLADVPMRSLRDADAATFRDGNRFVAELDGVRYHFKLLTGEDLEKVARWETHRPGQDDLLHLQAKILGVETNGETAHPNDIPDIVANLPLMLVRRLREEFDAHDGGMDTTMRNVECPRCGRRMEEFDLPFEKSFFNPPRSRASSAR